MVAEATASAEVFDRSCLLIKTFLLTAKATHDTLTDGPIPIVLEDLLLSRWSKGSLLIVLTVAGVCKIINRKIFVHGTLYPLPHKVSYNPFYLHLSGVPLLLGPPRG